MKKIVILSLIWLGIVGSAYADCLPESGDTSTSSNSPVVTINDQSFTEGNTNNTQYITITIDVCPNKCDLELKLNTTDGTATSSGWWPLPDYQGISDYHVTFLASATDSCTKTYTVPLTVYGDSTTESDETLTATIDDDGTTLTQHISFEHDGTSPLFGHGTEYSDATITLVNDDGIPPDVYLVDDAQYEGDTTTSHNYDVLRLTHATDSSVDVQFKLVSYSDADAADSTDLDLTSSYIITIPAGSTSANIPVNIYGDDVYENDEVFGFEIVSVTSGNANIDPLRKTSTGTILNDDAALPKVFLIDASQNEGDSTNTPWYDVIRLDQIASSTVDVYYRLTQLTTSNAADGIDMTFTTGRVPIPAGSTTGAIPITIQGDTVPENDEIFQIEITSVSSNAQIDTTKDTSIGTILNDDTPPPTVSIDQTKYITEYDTTWTYNGVTVHVSNASSSAITVNYSIGTSSLADSVDASDILFVSNGSITIPAGTTSAIIPVTIFGDSNDEPNERFEVTLTSVSGGGVLTSSTRDQYCIGTLNNDDAPVRIYLDQTALSVTEGDSGTQTYSSSVYVEAASTLKKNVTINYTITESTPQSATANVDFVAVASGSITLPAGTTGHVPVSFSVIGDTDIENDETFEIMISSSDTYAAIDTTQDQTTVTIINDDFPPTVSSLKCSDIEGDVDHDKQCRLYLVNNATSNITITYNFEENTVFPINNGRAIAGVDFRADTGKTFVIPAGTRVGYFNLHILADTIYEPGYNNTGNEFGWFHITQAVDSSGHISTLEDYKNSFLIVDDDEPRTITLSSTALTVPEGDTGTNTFTTLLVNSDNPLKRDVNISYSIKEKIPVDATANVDFVAVASGFITLKAGTTGGIPVPFSIIGDTRPESDEEFVIEISSSDSYAVVDANQSQAIITIDDDDDLPTFIGSNIYFKEGDTSHSENVYLNLSARAKNTITVQYSIEEGSRIGTNYARDGQDFVAKTGTMIIPAGSISSHTTVQILGDLIEESLYEYFRIRVIKATDSYGNVFGAGSYREIRITDDDQPVSIALNQTAVTVDENDTSWIYNGLKVVAPGPVRKDIIINYTVKQTFPIASATANVDFVQVTSGSVTILKNTDSAVIPITIKGDTIIENDEFFKVQISSTDPYADINPLTDKAIVTIKDDDEPADIWIDSTQTFYEGNDTHYQSGVYVHRSRSSWFPLTVHYSISAGSVTPTVDGSDIEFITDGTVVIPPWRDRVSIPLHVYGDYIPEQDEHLEIKLLSVEKYLGLVKGNLDANRSISDVILKNDDQPVHVKLRSTDVSAQEGDSGIDHYTDKLYVDALAPLTHDINVSYTVVESSPTSAQKGMDFVEVTTPQVITLYKGTTGGVAIPFDIIGDYKQENNETFIVKLAPVDAGVIVDNSPATVTIIDNDTFDDNNSNLKIVMLKQINLKGNVKMIGNTMLMGNQAISIANSLRRLNYIDVDSDAGTYNSSSASIGTTDDQGVDINDSTIVWAGLFWQGYLHNDQYDLGIDSEHNYSITDPISATTDIQQDTKDAIKFKLNNDSYVSVTPDTVLWDQELNVSGEIGYKYAAFADITSLLAGKSPVQKYTVANVHCRKGKTASGLFADNLGNFGAWSLVIVYDNRDEIDEKVRNVTVYGGYKVVKKDHNLTFTLRGFRTPKEAPGGVDSTFSIFAGEGDRDGVGSSGDSVIITADDGDNANNPLTLVSSGNSATNFFNSSIDGVPVRDKSLTNNNGADIHTLQIGTKGASNNPISTNTSQATIDLTTDDDTYGPGAIVFATELYIPEVCYDYDIRIDDAIKLDTPNRTINTSSFPGSQLNFNFGIRSREGDFPLNDSKMTLDINNTAGISNLADTAYALPNRAHFYPMGTSNPLPFGYNANTTTGGTIHANETHYLRYNYDMSGGSLIRTTYDLRYDFTIDFGSGPAPLSISTADKLQPCGSTTLYKPVYGLFNTERPFSSNYSTSNPDQRYALYTQVAGRPFSLDLVFYDSTNNYTQESSLSPNTDVEISLISADRFRQDAETNTSSFVCNFPDPIPGTERLIEANSSRVPLDFNVTFALPNVAIRTTYLADVNGSIVSSNCSTSSDPESCFDTLYSNTTFNDNNNTYCSTECSSSATGCYQCLKEYFGRSVCSRDNFAIRPEAFSIALLSGNTLLGKNDTDIADTNGSLNMIAEYGYRIEANATLYGSNNAAKYYYRNFTDANISAASVLINENNGTSCVDTDDTSVPIVFVNGFIGGYEDDNASTPIDFNTSGGIFAGSNVGNYVYQIFDNSFTHIDQKNDPSNPFPSVDACTQDSDAVQAGQATATNEVMHGCNITSSAGSTVSHYDIPVLFWPDEINASQIQLVPTANSGTDFVYMNDTNDSIHPASSQMGLDFNGTLRALGANKGLMTNFDRNCFGTDYRIAIDFNATRSEDSGSMPEDTFGNALVFQFLDRNVSTWIPPVVNNDDEQNISDVRGYANFKGGIGSFDSLFSIKKDPRYPANPLNIQFKHFSITLLDQNGTKINIPTHGHIYTQNDLNVSKYFYYGFALPQKDFFDDITEDSITIPISMAIYCDESEVNCAQYGIDTNDTTLQTTEYVWWINNRHTDVPFGSLGLQVQENNISSVTPADDKNALLFQNGLVKNISVNYSGSDRPKIIHVEQTVNSDPWMLYQPDATASTLTFPLPYFKVRFIRLEGWTGKGETGHVVDSQIHNEKNTRLGW